MTELTLASALIIGLLGSTHCIGMCGGIGSVLGANVESGHSGRLFSYNIGRLLTYTMIGTLAGLFGEQLLIVVPQLGIALRTVAGLLLIAMGLYICQWWMGLTRLEQVGSHLWKKVQPLSKNVLPINSNKRALGLGILWGLLPCGLVYSTLSLALASAHWQQSGLLMLAFGVGTLPAMLSIGFINEKLLTKLRKGNLRIVAGLIIIGMGLVTIITPWKHAGHSDMGGEGHPHSHHH